jgi:hypothetical protein
MLALIRVTAVRKPTQRIKVYNKEIGGAPRPSHRELYLR